MSSRDMRESNSSKTYSLVMQHQVKASGILFKEQRISTSNLSHSLVIFKVLWVFSVSSYEVVRSPVVDQYSSNYCRQLVRQLPLHSSHKIGETLGKPSESTLLKWRQGIGNYILGPSNRTPFSSHLEPETPKRRRNRQKLEYEYNSVQYGVCYNRSFWGARRLMVLKVSSEDLSHRVSTTIFQRSRPERVDCGLRVTEVLGIFVTQRFSALWKVLCISKPYCIYFDLALCNWTRIWISYQAFLCCQIARFTMEERSTSERKERYRLVVPKHAQTKDRLRDPHSKHNRGNAIKTTKYSIWSFLPKNLFEQFHRFANIYFLVIVILNLIPEINAFGKYIAMAPLIFVLSVTAIKDLFEDRRRYRSDKAVNNSTCFVFNR